MSAPINIKDSGKVIGVGVEGDRNIIGDNIYITYANPNTTYHQLKTTCKPPEFTGENKIFVGRSEEKKR